MNWVNESCAGCSIEFACEVEGGPDDQTAVAEARERMGEFGDFRRLLTSEPDDISVYGEVEDGMQSVGLTWALPGIALEFLCGVESGTEGHMVAGAKAHLGGCLPKLLWLLAGHPTETDVSPSLFDLQPLP